MEPKYPKRLSLAHLPTSVEHLNRLSSHLRGPDIFMKRDDQTGLATGGNKTRKLEFLVAEALAQGCDALITTGAQQSNHCRQTAAAAAKMGMACSLVLRGDAPPKFQGNLLLDELLGAHLYWTGERKPAEVIPEVIKEMRSLGRNPYVIPLGGSNVVGATAYVKAMEELVGQLNEQRINIDFIVFASSSGGTQAGLVLGAHIFGFHGKIYGISVDHPAESLATQVGALTTATATHLGLAQISLGENILVNDDYLGDGYAVVGELERDAIRLVGRQEGILLDPVYTGRAMGGLIDLISWGAFTRGQTVLFWHTGGTAALPAFADKLI